ncbi:MAG: ATP-binding protein [Granulosicoccus sp.]
MTLLVSSGVLIATLYAFNSWSFNRGFLNYINDSEIESLQPLLIRLADGYADSSNWDWLTTNDSLWPRLVSNSNRDSRSGPRDLANRQTLSPEGSFPGDKPPRRNNGVKGPKRGVPPPDRLRRLLLADAEKQILIGRPDPNRSTQWLPISHADSVVGYVGYKASSKLPRQLDNVFANQQKRSFAIASLIMIALSAVLAALLSSRIVRPVLQLSGAVSRISQGKFSHRIDSDRQDELGDLSRDINQLAHTLEHSRTARREWIAELSHELRTPVAILQSEVEAIEDGVRPLDMQAINSLYVETLRLSHLINDLHVLSLSDVGALEYQMDSLNLLSVVEERCNAVEALRSEQRISLKINAELTDYSIKGDAQRLGQLLDNLLQNSLRYTDEGGQIEIELAQHDNKIYLSWHDSTPGLLDKQLPKLFEPLFRADESRNRTQGGSGLGLSIVQKIVLAHQGSIEASHSPLGGLAINIQFPKAVSK